MEGDARKQSKGSAPISDNPVIVDIHHNVLHGARRTDSLDHLRSASPEQAIFLPFPRPPHPSTIATPLDLHSDTVDHSTNTHISSVELRL